jgi:hypothetical protein
VSEGLTGQARAAFEWLLKYNETYSGFVEQHRALLQVPAAEREEGWFVIKTAQLLLRMPGVEVAARPWLYPLAEYGDSDLRPRLLRLNQITRRQKPSIKSSWTRKLTSRCVSYESDFELFSLLYDIHLAKQISSVVTVADKQQIAPEEAAAGMQNFDAFWGREREKLEDMCRQQKQMPNLFFTIAPAEWKFNWHRGVQHWRKATGSLSQGQALMTLHMHHVIGAILKDIVLRKGSPFEELAAGQDGEGQAPRKFKDKTFEERYLAGVEEILEYSFRWEFQGRGTLHVHVVAWVRFRDEDTFEPSRLNGKSNQQKEKSTFLQYLEALFRASVDVQCGSGTHCLLNYVTGYVSKASDALNFKQKDYRQEDTSRWRQIYRLLCKKAPLLPEMAVEFAGLPLMEASYRGSTIYAPLPKAQGEGAGDKEPAKGKQKGRSGRQQAAKNASRAMYEAYLQHQQTMHAFARREGAAQQAGEQQERQNFISWARLHTVAKSTGAGDEIRHDPKRRGGHGVGKNKEKCALGVHFAYELLDIFIGQWCATMVPHSAEEELAPKAGDDTPMGARYLKAALDHRHYAGDATKLLNEIVPDLELRGLGANRVQTFKARIKALKLLLDNTGDKGLKIPANIWDARRIDQMPARLWSPEQAAVLDTVRKGVAVDDANVNAHSRMLLVTGKPGSGKTEAVIGCAIEAAGKGERVLIACPLGALVDVYRQKLPPNENIVVETIHASHRITRAADEQYVPPGRLRTFDLIIYDEVSQLEDSVWQKVRTAIVELNPHPFVCFVGDFKQLQPAFGDPELKDTLESMAQAGTLRHIELQQHPHARSNDPRLLDFLGEIREHQPNKQDLVAFFSDRRLAQDLNCRKDAHLAEAVAQSIAVERATGKAFTFLTATDLVSLKHRFQ